MCMQQTRGDGFFAQVTLSSGSSSSSSDVDTDLSFSSFRVCIHTAPLMDVLCRSGRVNAICNLSKIAVRVRAGSLWES